MVVELRGPLERRPADERRLLHPHRPVHADPAWRRVELRVHPDDHVALLEPQPEQRLEAVRPDAEIRAQVHERAPQLERAVDRVMELERGLAGEAEAHDVGRHARDVGVDVAQEPGWFGETGTPQQLPGERSRDVDRGEGHRAIEDVDAESPGLDPVAHPHLGVCRATGREAQDELRLGLAQDHAVVHDVAALVEQQRVARAAWLDVGDVARVEPLQGLHDVRPGHDELAERADVTQRHAFTDGPVLGDRVAVVPRSPPVPEPVHPRPEREVLVVERRPPEGIDVGVRGRLTERDLARGRASGERCRHLAGPRGDPRADVGQARAALARAETRLARALEQLELREIPCPMRPRGPRRSCPCTGRPRPRSAAAGAGRPRPRRPPRSVAPRRPSGPGDREGRGPGRGSRCLPSSPSHRRTSRPPSRRHGPDPPRLRIAPTAPRPASRPPLRAVSRPTRRYPATRPAACSRSAARAVSRPRSPLPGTAGWISAAPVATTISWAWTWSIPARVRTTSIGPA